MQIINKGKQLLADSVYFLYQKRFLKNPLKVKSLDQTIDELLNTEKSFVRFGDGEIRMIEGDSLPLQRANEELAKRLREILGTDEKNLMIGIPDIFDSLQKYRPESQKFWKEHLLFFRKKYEKYCNVSCQYFDAFFSRLYYMYDNRELSTKRFEKIKDIWKNKNIVVIESKSAHTGVDNDLLIMADSVRRIICPENNAYVVYGQLLTKAKTYSKDTVFLISAGATAKPLIVDLMKAGYRAIDIGSLDMEYQWYCMNVTQKCHPAKKNCVTVDMDYEAGYHEYVKQIDAIIEGAESHE